jgi:hypothetical protein
MDRGAKCCYSSPLRACLVTTASTEHASAPEGTCTTRPSTMQLRLIRLKRCQQQHTQTRDYPLNNVLTCTLIRAATRPARSIGPCIQLCTAPSGWPEMSAYIYQDQNIRRTLRRYGGGMAMGLAGGCGRQPGLVLRERQRTGPFTIIILIFCSGLGISLIGGERAGDGRPRLQTVAAIAGLPGLDAGRLGGQRRRSRIATSWVMVW